tara:strand:- start:193 stop:411 length:219 start_codon:yes stop_codon:yes gene_type:complete
MQFSKKEKEELIESVSYDLNRIRGLADNPDIFLSRNKNGSIRKNSSYTPEMVAEARERKVFLEGLLTKLNQL